jgi:hypothetical protein
MALGSIKPITEITSWHPAGYLPNVGPSTCRNPMQLNELSQRYLNLSLTSHNKHSAICYEFYGENADNAITTQMLLPVQFTASTLCSN